MLVFSLKQITVHPNTMSSFAVLACSLLWLTMVPPSSAQPGFINIDCGAMEGFISTTNLTWVTDTGYISTGQVATLPDPYNNLSTALQTVRYFPEDTIKSCYELSPVIVGVGYIVRARFYYGNYDGKGTMPTFALIIDATVMVDPVRDDTRYEMYVPAKSSSISVCLARSISVSLAGDPFISYLQLCTIPSGTSYDATAFDNGYGLYNIYGVDLGSNSSSVLRYPDDRMDRIWLPFASSLGNSNLETGHEVEVDNIGQVDYAPPILFQTATTGSDLPYPHLTGLSSNNKYHILFFFAEISPKVTAPGQRVFDIYSNVYKDGLEPWVDGIDVFNSTGGQFKGLRLLAPSPVTPVNDSILITFKASPNSTYGPIISGIQVLLYTEPLSNLTYFFDVSAIQEVKANYQLQGWIGDPCMPMNYSWSWVRCTFSPPPTIPRISSIIMSEMELIGNISEHFSTLPELTEIYLDRNLLTGPIPDLSSLSNLQTLDLQNNNLSGTIPDWLGSLPSLKELFLQNNEFEGDVPHALLKKVADNKLNFTYGGNSKLTCNGQSCDVLISQPSSPSPQTTIPPPPSPSSSAPQNISILFMFSFIQILIFFFL